MIEKKIVESIVISFIKKMGEWEKECNKIEKDRKLNFDQQFSEQKKILLPIFDEFCTEKQRLEGRPNTISYGADGLYEYDVDNEKVIKIEQEKSNRIVVYTSRREPMPENFMYDVLKIQDKWLIDSKKRESSWEKKWKAVSL